MLNRVILQGRLVADPELRHTQNNIAVATYRIAVDRNYATRDANGNRQTQADFINIVSWRQSAEFVAKYFTKGRMILVEGQLQVRDYTDRDGNRRYVTEVVTDNVQFCDSRRDNQSSGSYGQSSYGATTAPSSYAPQTASPANEFAELNDDDGELPF
ncbi:MAG: single-stranded DNA-binding protein [Clostridiales bacterium]|nr:single-stranded DNA-binding protein [Clostridiales bacterium]